MKSKKINWVIQTNGVAEVVRYCHNCGQKVIFRDSLVRRQNANGKNIHHFAIFKCDKGHTWNQKIEQFKTKEHLENKRSSLESVENHSVNCEIAIKKLMSEGYNVLEIAVESNEKIRVDKLLSQKITDQSRTQLEKWFMSESITVNDKIVTGSYKIFQSAVIKIYL